MKTFGSSILRLAFTFSALSAVVLQAGCKRWNFPYGGHDAPVKEADSAQPDYTVKVDPNNVPAH